jgi:dTDP-4-dehydrorhamnose reductase
MKILIIGATGMLGHKMLQVLGKAFPNTVYGTVRKNKAALAAFQFVPEDFIFSDVDVEKSLDVIGLLDQLKPQVIVNCTGITLRKVDNASAEKNFQINSLFPQLLGKWAQQNDSRLIHFSTDCVFDGKKGNYNELDFPTADDVYGKSKFLGEASGSHALTLRVSIVGREIFEKTELIEWFLSQKNKSIRGFSEVYYTGLTTLFLAHEVVQIIKKHTQLSGVYQISSQKISKYELLALANEIFKNQCHIENDTSKKSDKSLVCERYKEATGFVQPEWKTMLTDLFKDNSIYERAL